MDVPITTETCVYLISLFSSRALSLIKRKYVTILEKVMRELYTTQTHAHNAVKVVNNCDACADTFYFMGGTS